MEDEEEIEDLAAEVLIIRDEVVVVEVPVFVLAILNRETGDRGSRGRGPDNQGRGRGDRGSSFGAYNTQLGDSTSVTEGFSGSIHEQSEVESVRQTFW